MKLSNKKIIFQILMLLLNAAVFAQPNPDPDGVDADPQDLLAPIDSYIYILVAFGLLFVS